MTTLEKYIWVVNALYRAGSHGLSLKELSDKWELDESIGYGEPLPRQTFNRWKDNILMSLGVNIDCRLKGGYRYYISNPESLANGELSRWLLDTYSTANTLSQNTLLKDRILVEEIPSSRHFLTDIVDAMKVGCSKFRYKSDIKSARIQLVKLLTFNTLHCEIIL